MPQLEDFLATWESEFQTTVRVFENYPAARLGYRPHEISRTAHELMWTIAYEEGEMIEGCLRGNITFGEESPRRRKRHSPANTRSGTPPWPRKSGRREKNCS
jgi:hypothetical protein